MHMKSFLNFIYLKGEAMFRVFFSYKFLVITGDKHLYAVRNGLTIGDTKEITKYLDKLVNDTITEKEAELLVKQVNKIISGVK